MPVSRAGRQGRFWLLLFVMLVSIGTTTWYVARQLWSPAESLRRWRQQLASLPEEKAADYLLSHAGESIDPAQLIEALSSDRPLVSRAARDLLMETLDGWQLEPARYTSAHVAELADQLARRAGDWNPVAQDGASQLAVRLLRWPVDGQTVDLEQLITDCESVLRYQARSRQQHAALAQRDRTRRQPNQPSRIDSPPPAAHWRDINVPPSQAQFELPGGDLPIHAAQVPSPPPPDPTSGPVPQLEPTPRPPAAVAAPDQRRAADHGSYDRHRTTGPAQAPEPLEPTNVRQIAPPRITFSSAPGQVAANSPLQDLDDVAVMRRLHIEGQAEAAEAELVRRGYRSVHLQLARHLTDPSPEVRRQLAESLPGFPDALPWLRFLARDSDPDVRVTALSILATSSDPATKKWVRDALKDESDQYVSRQLGAALK